MIMTKSKIQKPNESKKFQNPNHGLNDLGLNDSLGFWIWDFGFMETI